MPFSNEKKENKIINNGFDAIRNSIKMARKYYSSRIVTDLISRTSAKFFSHWQKRAASFAFRKKAFITIEASISLTIFLMAALSILSFGLAMNQKMRLEAPLRNTCSKIAQDYIIYDVVKSDTEQKNIIEEYAVQGVGIVAAKQLFINEVGKANLDNSCIVNGSAGINFLYSDILDDEGYVDLIITYKIRLPFRLIPFPDMEMTQRSRIYSWIGSEVYGSENEEGSYVYVTRTGTVYHASLTCRHLNIKIRKTNISVVETLRNESGGKYHPCEKCYDNTGLIVYATQDGTAYHSSEECPSLVRHIKKVPLSETIGMDKCQYCGG